MALKGGLEVIFTPAVNITCGTPSNYIYLLLCGYLPFCWHWETDFRQINVPGLSLEGLGVSFPKANWFKRQPHARMCANHFTNDDSHSQSLTAWLTIKMMIVLKPLLTRCTSCNFLLPYCLVMGQDLVVLDATQTQNRVSLPQQVYLQYKTATDSGEQNDDAALGRPSCSCRLLSSTTQRHGYKN